MEGELNEESVYTTYFMLIFMVISVIGLVIVFKKRIMAAILGILSKRVHARLINQKNALFQQLRNEGRRPLNILEIGSGTGVNFKYYPEGTILTCLEPNPHHENYLRKNLVNMNPKIELKEFVCGYAEDLSRFKDGEFDAVVETLVLCSVKSTTTVLQEIKRVLKPGGKFYFIDHVAGHGHSHGGHGTHTSTCKTETEEEPLGTYGTHVTHRSHTTHDSHRSHTTHDSHRSHTTHDSHRSQTINESHTSQDGDVAFFHRMFHRLFHRKIDAISRNREIAAAIENARFSQMEFTNFKMQMPILPWKSACIYGTATKF